MADASVKLRRIEAICITHLHGDHVNGLPSLLCTLSSGDSSDGRVELTIVGPQGLAALVVSSLAASAVAAPLSLTILELAGTAHRRTPSLGAHIDSQSEAVLLRGGGTGPEVVRRLIPQTSDGEWAELPSLAGFTARAVALRHNVPCVGYTFEETLSNPLAVDGEAARRRVAELAEPLQRAGFDPPIRALGELQRGRAITAADGSTVLLDPADESLCRPVSACRVGILGDHCAVAGRQRARLRDLDLLVHECTVTGFGSADEDRVVARQRFHSSPEMAGELSAALQPGLSALTHISGRIEPGDEQELADRAAAAAGVDVVRGECALSNLAGLPAAGTFVVTADNTTFELGKRIAGRRAPITIHDSRKPRWALPDK